MIERKPATIASIVVILVAVAVGVALTRTPVQVDPGTPEAAVQEFSQAVIDGDLGAALAVVAEPRPTRLRCNPRPGLRITLAGTTSSGDTARVDVRVTEYPDGGGFPGQGSTWDDAFQLERSEGTWYLVSWPWALCELPPVKP